MLDEWEAILQGQKEFRDNPLYDIFLKDIATEKRNRQMDLKRAV